jgi:hypothetical protein
MNSFPEQNSSQASEAEPTIEEIKKWDEDDLLKWFKRWHPEQNSSQASEAEPTIEEIKKWDEDDLLKWIKRWHPKLLKDDDLKKLKRDRVDGVLFLNHAGDKNYFLEECKLASGTSERLADLAREMAGGETADMVRKGKEQDTSTGKSTPRHASHADIVPGG